MLATVEHRYYAKTEKGAQEISQRRQNLRGKMRTMLILVDASKSADELMEQAQALGAPPDFLEVMLRDGYIAPTGKPPARREPPPLPAVARTRDPHSAAAGGRDPSPTLDDGAQSTADAPSVSDQELARFRAAKSFMNVTVVDALGVRAFLFTLKLERCATRADLAVLLPDYDKAIRKGAGEAEARVLGRRMRELLA